MESRVAMFMRKSPYGTVYPAEGFRAMMGIAVFEMDVCAVLWRGINMLHTVNKAPIKSNALKSAVRVAAEGDPILLFEDGVLAARPGAVTDPLVKETIKSHPVYALAPDLKARGIGQVIEGITTIGYNGFVDLVEEHLVVAWT